MRTNLFLGVALVLSLSTAAFAGRESGGGSQCLLKLQATQKLLLTAAPQIKSLQSAGVSNAGFSSILSKVTFDIEKNLTKDGKPVDALNYPDDESPRIVMDQDRCDAVLATPSDGMAFLVHEVLGLMRKETREDYSISKNVLIELKKIVVLNEDSRWQFSSLPNDGTYRLFGKGSECDISIESDKDARKIYLSLVSNQQTGEYCWNQKTLIYTCDTAAKCVSNGKDAHEITLIHERSFLLGQSSRYNFVNNEPIKPASKVTFQALAGFPPGMYPSVAGYPFCSRLLEGTGTYIRCDDKEYAARNFCPEAEGTAVNTVVSACETETGKKCSWVRKTPNEVLSYLRFSNCNNEHVDDTCTYFYQLQCRAEVTAFPKK